MYGALHRVGWKLRKFTAARCVILTEITGDFVPMRLCGDADEYRIQAEQPLNVGHANTEHLTEIMPSFRGRGAGCAHVPSARSRRKR